MHHREHARAVAERVATELGPDVLGIALVGSVATGTDHPHSDIDLNVAADTDPGVKIRQVEGRMVTLSRKPPADFEAAFQHPWEAGAAVPAWRTARILTDPHGIMNRLQSQAKAWTWEAIATEADRWAAGELVGLAEEIHKIHGMLALDRPRTAAANRALVHLSLAAPLAAAHRILYGSENDLWDAVADAEGPAWARAWDQAAGVTACDHRTGCRAALTLYRIAAARLAHHLHDADRALVHTACDLAAEHQGSH